MFLEFRKLGGFEVTLKNYLQILNFGFVLPEFSYNFCNDQTSQA
jgi:hypothetical protein